MRRLIFGCGYLGTRVARLWQNQGDTVFAVTRSEDRCADFEREGWRPRVGDVTVASTLQSLPEVDTILVAEAGNRTRVVLNLDKLVGYETRRDGNSIFVTLESSSKTTATAS